MRKQKKNHGACISDEPGDPGVKLLWLSEKSVVELWVLVWNNKFMIYEALN